MNGYTERSLARNGPGKKRRTIFKTVFTLLLIAVVLEIGLMLSAVFGMEIPQRLRRNAEQILMEQVENRASYLRSMLLEAEELDSFMRTVSGKTQQYLRSGGRTAADLNSVEETADLLNDLKDDLIRELRAKPVNGIFVIYNTQDLRNVPEETTLPGIYLRDLDPDAPDSARNEDISFEFAPSRVVHLSKISTDGCWQPGYAYTAADGAFVYKPFQAAYEDDEQKDYTSYGYWTEQLFRLPGDTKEVLTYSVPILLADGTVCGVIGVEFQAAYLQSKLPYTELNYAESGGYLLAYVDGTTAHANAYALHSTVTSSQNQALLEEKGSFGVHCDHAGAWMTVQGQRYYVYSCNLDLYSRNAPFSNDVWTLSATVSRQQLYGFSKVVHNLFLVIAVAMLALGAVSSLIISQKISWPITNLYREILDYEHEDVSMIPKLPDTGIVEVDSFADAFTKLSQDVLDTSTRFLRIIELASVEIGGYELRCGDERVYVTDNFFPLLGIESPSSIPVPREEFSALMERFYASTRIVSRSGRNEFTFEVVGTDHALRFILMKIREEKERQVGLIEDVTDSEVERQRLEHERDFDTLTGLYNRSAFTAHVKELFAKPEAIGRGALFMFDLDNLKKINDLYGHEWGDAYIQLASRCIRDNLPKDAVCSHFSGDEFFAFVCRLQEDDAAAQAAETFLKASRQYMLEMPDGTKIPVSASCGIARYPEDSTDYQTLRRYADFAMYQVKNSQKGKVKLFDAAAYDRNNYDIQMRRELVQLLEQESVQYHFQPIFSARTGEAVAYEALMRVYMETLKSPGDVMSVAHRMHKLYEVEKLTVSKSLKTFLDLQEKHLVGTDTKLFINSISSVVLTDEDFASCYPLLEAMRGHMVVEITEGEKLDYDLLRCKKKRVDGLASFALDDYGSGYSNDTNLLELSPEYIKIDYGIIHNIDADQDKKQIVINIVSYAHQRGKKIIAEGIETAEELHCVIGLGVDLLQGFFLARPTAVPNPAAPEALEIIEALQKEREEQTL